MSMQLTFFQQQGTGQFSPAYYTVAPTALAPANPALLASQPAAGTSGWTFVVQRRFWGGRLKPKAVPSALPTPETANR